MTDNTDKAPGDSKSEQKSALPAIWVCGGSKDPNLLALIGALKSRYASECTVFPVLFGRNVDPTWNWDLESDTLSIDSKRCAVPSGAFLRHDVFTYLEEKREACADRASAFHAAFTSYLHAHRDVTIFNRDYAWMGANKPLQLVMARKLRMLIPSTIVSNSVQAIAGFHKEHDAVLKPIGGGGYCELADEALKRAPKRGDACASPAIVQEKLVSPEFRVYLIGERVLAFRLQSPSLDYREKQDAVIEALPDSWWREHAERAAAILSLRQLAAAMGLTFSASDFKTCARTGRLVFLEINSQPMFAGFDSRCRGALIDAIAEFLLRKQKPLELPSLALLAERKADASAASAGDSKSSVPAASGGSGAGAAVAVSASDSVAARGSTAATAASGAGAASGTG